MQNPLISTVGCAKTQESICLKSSIGQLLMWRSGLLFSEEKTADYSLSSCMQHATYSGVKQLSGKTKTTWNRSALVEVSCGYQSQPLALCSELLWFTVSDSLQVKVQPNSLAYQAIFFQISTSQYSITVGCRFAWCRIRWFQPLAVPRLKSQFAWSPQLASY